MHVPLLNNSNLLAGRRACFEAASKNEKPLLMRGLDVNEAIREHVRCACSFANQNKYRTHYNGDGLHTFVMSRTDNDVE